MNINQQYSGADPKLVEIWVKGWALARNTVPPIPHKDGFKIKVGWPKQLVRYVFPCLSEELVHLANTISTPWHFLKACASPMEVRQNIPSHWEIQPPGYLMTSLAQMHSIKSILPDGLTLLVEEELSIIIVKIVAGNGEIASIGRIAIVEDFAIYDRIETRTEFRRLGLARIIMKTLYEKAVNQGIHKGVLVATAEGKLLYESLGWQLHSLYTTAVIPGHQD